MALDVQKYTEDFFKLPRPALQKRWVREYEAVTTHTHGKTAKRLIKERRPYEDKEIHEYRITNYEPVTQGPFSRFMTNLSRVFSAAQVTIDTGNEVVQEYITGPNFYGMDLRAFWSRRLTPRDINDPNGVLVRMVVTTPEDPTARVQPELHLVLSRNIVHFTQDVFTWLTGLKSMVLAPDPAGGREDVLQPLGKVYYVVTTTQYWRFEQYGKQADNLFRMVLMYTHNLNRFPLDILGGEEACETNKETNEDEVWQKSFVCSALPAANECARQFSDHQAVLVVSGFPVREMTPVDCTYTSAEGYRCTEGWLNRRAAGYADRNERVVCPGCKGSGKAPPPSQYGIMLRGEVGPISGAGAKAVADKPMIDFLHPDPAILEFGNKTWREYKADLEKELNLLFIPEAQSGTAKEFDKEDQVAKLDLLGHHLYLVLMRRTIIDFGELMHAPVDPDRLNITLPATFTVRTEDELSTEFKTAREAEMPAPLLTAMGMEFTQKRFPGDRTFLKATEVLTEYDPLFAKNDADVAALLASGVVDSVAVRRHVYAFPAIKRIIREKGDEALDKDSIFEDIDAMIEEMMPQERVDAELQADFDRNNPPDPNAPEDGPGGGSPFGKKKPAGGKKPPPAE